MLNYLVLYNPYYQSDVIVSHVNVLLSSPDQKKSCVAFGKIRSKLKENGEISEDAISTIAFSIAQNGYMQLFLTDYSDMYVAKVIAVTKAPSHDIAPKYYAEKNLDIEVWFIIRDIRQIVDNDFQIVRDKILSNITTPSNGDHHYAVYGNAYQFPLEIEMDNPIDYFAEAEYPYYTELFKSFEYIETKRHLIHYRFGEVIFHMLHPNSQESIISAEIEYSQNRRDRLYDFSAVVIKYAKAIELELYLFIREVMMHIMKAKPELENIGYQVQGVSYVLKDLTTKKPNIGTYKYLLGVPEIKEAFSLHIDSGRLKNFLQYGLKFTIHEVQELRNESAHGSATKIEECEKMRAAAVGIGVNGILCDLISNKQRLYNETI